MHPLHDAALAGELPAPPGKGAGREGGGKAGGRETGGRAIRYTLFITGSRGSKQERKSLCTRQVKASPWVFVMGLKPLLDSCLSIEMSAR